jgi:5-formyltetrahydrofolate cyclo-ligase
LLIEPAQVKGLEHAASTIKGAFKFGRKLRKLPKAELVVIGSVAVDRHGWRLGKGGGYGDKEIARLKQEGSITEKTPIVTTVHDMQLVAEVPHGRHDQPVSWIVTPTKVIRCR